MTTENTTKRATPDHPILPVLADRWSPYSFEPRPVERKKLLSCLEASRWAASSFNEQPWSFIVSPRDDQQRFKVMLGCLVEANRAWAQNAGVLIISVCRRTFTRNSKPNRVAEHDVALAVANLTVQATSLGLYVHQMAGIEIQKTRHTYLVPDGYDPVTGIALGYAAQTSDDADDELVQRDRASRSRKKLSEFVFADKWQQSARELTTD